MKPPAKFWLVASAGHCGTTWLSQVIGDQKDWIAHHELRYYISLLAWERAVGTMPQQAYWDQVNVELDSFNVLDSNSWAPFEIPMVDKVIPVDHVIYLVRNGVQQIHSLATKSNAYKNLPDESFTIGVWLRNWWNIGEDAEWEESTRFQKLCTLINASCYMPQWLRDRGFEVSVYRLEDLTSSINVLGQLAPNLSQEALCLWQRRDINRKVEGERDPMTLFESWEPENQQMFVDMCKDTMLEFGYWRNGYDRTR